MLYGLLFKWCLNMFINEPPIAFISHKSDSAIGMVQTTYGKVITDIDIN